MSAEKRLAMLEQVIAKGSTDPFHHYARALELRSLGRLEDAADALASVRDRFASYVPTYLMGAQVAIELDRLVDGREWLEQGLEVAHAAGDSKAEGELRELLATLGDAS